MADASSTFSPDITVMVEATCRGERPGEGRRWGGPRGEGWGGPKRPPHQSARLPHAQGGRGFKERRYRDLLLCFWFSFPPPCLWLSLETPRLQPRVQLFFFFFLQRVGMGEGWCFVLVRGALTQCCSRGQGHRFGGHPGLPSPLRALLGLVQSQLGKAPFLAPPQLLGSPPSYPSSPAAF